MKNTNKLTTIAALLLIQSCTQAVKIKELADRRSGNSIGLKNGNPYIHEDLFSDEDDLDFEPRIEPSRCKKHKSKPCGCNKHKSKPCRCNKHKPCGCHKHKPCGCDKHKPCGCDKHRPEAAEKHYSDDDEDFSIKNVGGHQNVVIIRHKEKKAEKECHHEPKCGCGLPPIPPHLFH